MAAGKLVLGNGTAPSTPSAGYNTLYFKADKKPYYKDDTGLETAFTTGSGGITQLTGDVTAGPGSGSQVATVAFVGGSTASAVNTAAVKVAAATAAATSNTLALRDGSANIAFGTVTASLAGDVLFASTIGTVPVATVLGAVTDVGNATSAATSNTIVKRDGFANFAAGTITATLNGNALNVTGVVAIANGGTGQSNQQAGLNNLTDIGSHSNGDVLQLLAGNAQFAPYSAPGTTGTPNTPSYYDSLGDLTSIPGRTVDPTTFAQAINLTSTSSVANFSVDAVQYTLDVANTSDNITSRYDNLIINGTLTDRARLWNGNMSGASTNVTGLDLYSTANATNDFTLATFTSTGSVGNNLQGLFVSNFGPITGQANLFSMYNNQTIGGALTFANWTNNTGSAVTGGLRFLDWNNSSTAANLSGLFLNSQEAIAGNWDFLSASISANVGGNTNFLNVNVQNTAVLSSSLTGLAMSNNAVFTGAGNRVQAVGLNNSATGDSVNAFSVNNSVDLDEAFTALQAFNTGDVRTATGVDISLSGNATDDVQGVRVNVNNQTSTNNRVRSIDLQGATYSASGIYKPTSGLFVDTGNNNFLEFQVASGSPLTGTDCLINNNIVAFLAQDDVAIGPVSLGLAHTSAISLVGIADTKQIDLIRGILVVASIQDPGYADAGVLDKYQGIVYSGALPGGGSTTVNEAIGLIMPSGFDSYATVNWGLRVEGSTADNYLNKLAINTSSMTAASGLSLDVAGEIGVTTAGKGISIKEGTNARMGTSVLVAGTVTVSTTAVTASSRIFLTIQTASGTIGVQYISARTAATSFTITSTDPGDTSTIAWLIVEPL